MTGDTGSLIERLASSSTPVKPLPSPERRAAAWLVASGAIVAAVMAWHGIDQAEVARALSDWRLAGEILASLVTAVSATIIGFRSIVPGQSMRGAWVPFLSLAAWVLLAGAACAADYAAIGPAAFALRVDTACFPPGAIAGGLIGLFLIVMLRRGAPLVPRLTLMFAGIAVAAIVNVGLLILHEGDISVMLLVWHTGYVVGLGAVGSAVGPVLLRWRPDSAKAAEARAQAG